MNCISLVTATTDHHHQPAKGLGLRHVQVLLLFTCMVLAYSLRVNMSIGIVAMMDNSANPEFVVRTHQHTH